MHNGYKLDKNTQFFACFVVLGTLVLSVMMLSACSPAEQKTSDSLVTEQISAPPLLTLSELLNADDVKASLALASEQSDMQSIRLWQERLLQAADEVNLRPSEIELISGSQGMIFLEFQGMKTNYQRDFDQAFYDFGDVDAVYRQYPAFESLHAKSRDLVSKRDALIESVAAELTTQGLSPDESTEEAKRQWQRLIRGNISNTNSHK